LLLSTVLLYNDTPTSAIYTLSLHDALPIFRRGAGPAEDDADGDAGHGDAEAHEDDPGPSSPDRLAGIPAGRGSPLPAQRPTSSSDRKSTRLNSSHVSISYAVFCLKKKKKKE